MRIEPLMPEGLHLLVPEPIEDERGFFSRSYSEAAMKEHGLASRYPEWSHSFNRKVGTLRGLHLQRAPHLECKLVQCVRGRVFDVAVDLRPGSKTFGEWHAVELSAENRTIFYIPDGFAHGFQTLTDEAELLYHISEPFQPGLAMGVRWDDTELAIDWPSTPNRIMSDRDANLPSLAEIRHEL